MKIAIIGCGVAGLSAARELSRHGVDVTLFDKSRGVGDWEFDHGAQYFTVQDPDFQAEIDAAIDAAVVAPWDAKALYLKTGHLSADTGRQRYVGLPRMNSLPKYWAEGLDVHLGKRVSSVRKSTTWSLQFEDGSSVNGFDGVISTLPPAQVALILPEDFGPSMAVSEAQMHVCFCLMVGLAAPINPGWDTLRVKDLPIDWISINHAKPGRSQDVGTIVIHSEARWSDAHVDADRGWVQDVMLKSASALLGLPLEKAPHLALHRWLYASNKTSPDIACLEDEGFVVAGDWCLGGRVQGAWLSGRTAAQAFL